MVHLHCAERGASPERPTHDADTVVDVRADPNMLAAFTGALRDLGFVPATSGEGHQHRWTRDAGNAVAQIDVLLPDGIGERAASRRGAGGAPTLQTPGGTQALHRSGSVLVAVEGRTGWVRRPNLVGALVMKAAAHTAAGDSAKGRHRSDFVTLAALLAARDLRDEHLTTKDRQRLRAIVAATRADEALMLRVTDAERSLTRIERAVGLL
jgi:hypothetical protein